MHARIKVLLAQWGVKQVGSWQFERKGCVQFAVVCLACGAD
jgi:hypothetical protein